MAAFAPRAYPTPKDVATSATVVITTDHPVKLLSANIDITHSLCDVVIEDILYYRQLPNRLTIT